MKRRVVLVDLYWTRDKDPRIPLGHGSLLAALQVGFTGEVRSVVIAVNRGNHSPESVVTMILEHMEHLPHDRVDVAIGAYVWAESLLQRVLPLLRARFKGRIILGGPQISYAGEGLERTYPDADVFVRGYGEQALCALAADSGRPPIPGVHYAGSNDEVTQARVDLETLPSPLLTGLVPLLGRGFVRWESQRGCPFRCSFCQHREPGAQLRRRELADSRVMQEIDLLCAYEVAEIAVLDPIFNASPKGTEILERFATNGFKGRLSLQCRAEYIDERFLDAASQLDVKLEFGLQTIHDDEGRAVDRRNGMAKVETALKAVRERNLDHEVSLIFGLPMQTLLSFIETVRWCLERRVPIIKAFPLMLLRGTKLDRQRAQWRLVEDGDDMPCVVESNTFTRQDWQAMGRISEALRRTEGNHPTSIDALLRLADSEYPRVERWRPIAHEGPPPTRPSVEK